MRPRSLLDGFFSDDVGAITRACGCLAAGAGVDAADRSHGRVTHPGAMARGRPESGGVLCEGIFGPIAVLACACGKTKGPESRGVVCDRCGVLCSDPGLRDWRFGHVEIGGAVHPLLIDAIASALEMARAELMRIVRPAPADDDATPARPAFERVDELLAARGPACAELRAAAIVRCVPMHPPGDRPLVERLAITMRTPWAGPLNDAWGALLQRGHRQLRLMELNAPDVILAQEAIAVQRGLDAVFEAVARPPAPHPAPWRTLSERAVPCAGPVQLPRTWISPWGDVERTRPVGIRGLFFLDDGTLLVHRAEDTVRVRTSGALVTRTGSSLLCARSQHGARVVCDRPIVERHHLPEELAPPPAMDDSDGDGDGDGGAFHDVAVLDVHAGAWLPQVPRDVPCVVGEKDQPEDLALVDARSGDQVACPFGGNDRPAVLAWTRDARFVWLGSEHDGGVLDVETAVPHVVPLDADTRQRVRVPSVDVGRAERDDIDDVGAVWALALTPEQDWRFFGTGVDENGDERHEVFDEGRALLSLSGSVGAAAFSPDAAVLAVARSGSDEVVLVDVAAGQVRGRFTVR